jgi:hypothetical protein
MGGSTGNLARHFRRKHPTESLQWTPTLVELSDLRSTHDGGFQQYPAVNETAAAVMHEDTTTTCPSRSMLGESVFLYPHTST